MASVKSNEIKPAAEKSEKKTAKAEKAETEINLSFEEALANIDKIVRQLENGNAPLDDSLALYEEGVRLVSFCKSKIENAEERITVLTKNGKGIEEKDFPKGGRNG